MSYNTVVGWLVIAVGCWPLGGIIWQLTNAFRSRSWTGRAQEAVLYPGFEKLEIGSVLGSLVLVGIFIGTGLAVLLEVFG